MAGETLLATKVAWYVLICLPFIILPIRRAFPASCTRDGSFTNGHQSGHRVGAVSESGAAAGSSCMKQWRLGFDSVARVLLDVAAAPRSLVRAKLHSTAGVHRSDFVIAVFFIESAVVGDERGTARGSAMVQLHRHSHCFLSLKRHVHSFEHCWDEGRFQKHSARA